MRLSTVFVVAICGFSSVYCAKDDDRGDLSNGDSALAFANLPLDVQTDFYKILTGAANALGGGCVGVEPNYEKVELLLFTNDPDNYTRLDPKNPVGIDYTAPLYLLTHGWVSGLNGYKIKGFRDKYVQLYGKNIIFINWGKLAWYPYTSSYCDVPYIGQFVAQFLCDISEKHNYDLKNVHMIGHSLGGQMCGQTGKATQRICQKKMGKLTGLDPAGPLYTFTSDEKHLTPADAEFVEVIHTSGGQFGYLGKCGTVDYFINCGSTQPGCIVPQDFSKIAETSIFFLCCAHMRAVEIWPYILESREFKGKSCAQCPGLVPGTCIPDAFGANYVSVGHTTTKPKSGEYNVITGPYPPFSLGCKAYPLQGCV